MEKKNARPAEAETSANHSSNPTDLSTTAQRLRLLEALRNGQVDTFQAREVLNIMMPAARVKELRLAGFEILTLRVRLPDAAGIEHNGVARYVLISEPPAKAAA
ncbi:helix-turn-helix domain-containing protein [Chromobacterium vaccinii]|uniref:helix-turn-helix domain-containing protein n=1 Tax=Chromobacterium vaccinii TaxID=1108595 RepID=UPI0031D7201D